MKQFLFFPLLFLAAPLLFSFGAREKTQEAPEEARTQQEKLAVLDTMENLWKEKNIRAYSARVAFMRMALPPDHITLTVRDGLVTEYASDPPGRNYSPEFIASLTAESLYKRLRSSLESSAPAVMEYRAVYDDTYGYIRQLTRVAAKNLSAEGQAPRDAGYSIHIMDFSVLP